MGASDRFWEHLVMLSRRHSRHGKGKLSHQGANRSRISKCGVGAARVCRPGCSWLSGGPGGGETSLAMEPGLLPDPVQDYRLITACQAGPQTQGRTVSLGGSQT